jgi:hypothetical protein
VTPKITLSDVFGLRKVSRRFSKTVPPSRPRIGIRFIKASARLQAQKKSEKCRVIPRTNRIIFIKGPESAIKISLLYDRSPTGKTISAPKG